MKHNVSTERKNVTHTIYTHNKEAMEGHGRCTLGVKSGKEPCHNAPMADVTTRLALCNLIGYKTGCLQYDMICIMKWKSSSTFKLYMAHISILFKLN